MKKRICSLMLAGIMILTIPASATECIEAANTENTKEVVLGTVVTKEFDAFQQLANIPEQQLLAEGYSEQEINELKSFSYEDALYERAQLPEETLLSYGYTQDEIAILKEYNGETITEESAVYSLSAELTSRLTLTYANSREYMLHYDWSWDGLPLNTDMTETAAIRWKGVDVNGHEVDMSAENAYAVLKYYYPPDALARTRTVRNPSSYFTSYQDFNTIQCKFKMLDSDLNYVKNGALWATISVDDAVTNETVYIKVSGLYGHGSVSASPSISVSGDVSLSFTGTTLDLAPQSYKIYADGSREQL
ncbi:hypothetical protein [Oscillibacter valericigenes]|uniref:hypothetical protein n=1 Tax=Oscillibacter valericigenes TaxID=351091 RepID=UPI001F22EE8F|nr:hypothetical protein [Oscillibacter valericigenes]